MLQAALHIRVVLLTTVWWNKIHIFSFSQDLVFTNILSSKKQCFAVWVCLFFIAYIHWLSDFSIAMMHGASEAWLLAQIRECTVCCITHTAAVSDTLSSFALVSILLSFNNKFKNM